jgi:hypothetical protein
MKPIYYLVTSPETSFTWIGGPVEKDGNHVWLMTPHGERILRVPKAWVTKSSRTETARRLEADRQAAQSTLN